MRRPWWPWKSSAGCRKEDPRLVKIGVARSPIWGILQKGYTRKDQNWSLTTTSVTADQQIGSLVVTNGKTLKVQAVIIEVYLTALSTTAAYLGTLKIRWGTGTLIGPLMASNTSSGALFGLVVALPDEGLEVGGDGSLTLNAVCTPAAATSTVWRVTVVCYERD